MSIGTLDYEEYIRVQNRWLESGGYPLPHDFDVGEYQLRIQTARRYMAAENLDALVVTSGLIGQWFTSALAPHEWHDRCQSRSAWYILTPADDYLLMTPTTAGEHMNTTRRSTWVTNILPLSERSAWPRAEIWDIEQIPEILSRLGLPSARMGFELGDCMTLGLSVNDLLRLRELLPRAQIVDGSTVIRKLMSIHTPLEIERLRMACRAGVWMHDQVVEVLRPAMTEKQFVAAMNERFLHQWDEDYTYVPASSWDVRNAQTGDSNLFHAGASDRSFKAGDYLARGNSGVSYRGYSADVDRGWHVGTPSDEVRRYFAITWECNQAMAEAIKPGNRCSDIYAACVAVEKRYNLPERRSGRIGHGYRNTGGLSVHPGNHTVLEPNMVISVEPMFATDAGWFDLEDQYLVTATGREILHPVASPDLPIIAA